MRYLLFCLITGTRPLCDDVFFRFGVGRKGKGDTRKGGALFRSACWSTCMARKCASYKIYSHNQLRLASICTLDLCRSNMLTIGHVVLLWLLLCCWQLPIPSSPIAWRLLRHLRCTSSIPLSRVDRRRWVVRQMLLARRHWGLGTTGCWIACRVTRWTSIPWLVHARGEGSRLQAAL